MQDIAHKLYEETQAAKTLLSQMSDIVADDEEAKRNLVEGETNLREVIAGAIKQIGEDNAAIEGLGLYTDELKKRTDRLKQRVENMKTAIAVAMEQAHEKTLETPFGTVTLRATTRTAIVVDESEIPSQFWKPQPPKLDKSALAKAMKDGAFVAGVQLSNGGNCISIKRG